MKKRIALAAVLGGLTLFLWEALAHMVLPLGQAGMSALPEEATVLSNLKDTIKEPGFYYFPAPEERPGMTFSQKQDAMDRSMQRARTQVSGLMMLHPRGRDFNFGKMMGVQFGGDVVAMMLCAVLLAYAPMKDYLARVGFVATIGLIPTLQSDLPQWNWYAFPDEYLAAQFIVHFVGFFLAGLVLGRIFRPVAS